MGWSSALLKENSHEMLENRSNEVSLKITLLQFSSPRGQWVIGIDTNTEVIVVSLKTWEAHHSPRASPSGCGELPRSLLRQQWPKLRYQFLFYHDETTLMMNNSIMMLMKFSDLSQSDRSNWVMWQQCYPRFYTFYESHFSQVRHPSHPGRGHGSSTCHMTEFEWSDWLRSENFINIMIE